MQPNGDKWRCYVKRRLYRKAAEHRYRHSLKGHITGRRARLRAARAFVEALLKEIA